MLKYIIASFLIIMQQSVYAAPTFNDVEKKTGVKGVAEVNKTPVTGIYEVVTRDNKIFYVTENLNFIFSGEIIDINAKESLTRKKISKLVPTPDTISNSTLIELEKISLIEKKGTASKKLYVFTNPDCPFCKKLESTLENMSDVAIYRIILANENNIGNVRKIWCSENKMEAWHQALTGNQVSGEECQNHNDTIQKSLGMAKSLKIAGTPTLFNKSGERLSGLKTLNVIEQFISE